MGKVYDALRRAEEQRAQRSGEGGNAAATAAVEPTAPVPPVAPGTRDAQPMAPPPSRAGRGIWRRLGLGRKSRVQDTPAEINKRRIALLQPDSFVAEQFRNLRTRIDSIAAGHPEHEIRTIAVTSALRADGKTTTAIGLSAVTAMGVGKRVLLLDTDLREPSIARSLGLRPKVGVAEVLRGDATPEDAVLRVEGTELDVLPVRSVPSNPAELLASTAMRDLLNWAADNYDRVVLDLPPTLGLPDAKAVSELCDGVVFVVRAEETPREDVEAAIEVLDRRRILGLLLNGEQREDPRYEYRA